MKTNDNLTGRWNLTEIHYQSGNDGNWKLWMEFAPGVFTWEFEESEPDRGSCTQLFKGYPMITAPYAYFHEENLICLNYADTPHQDDFYRVRYTGGDIFHLYCLKYDEQEADDCLFRMTAKRQ